MSIQFHRSYMSSLSELTAKEQVRVNDALLQFTQDESHPGLRIEKLHRSDASMWSIRASGELRIIIQKFESHWHVLHAGHHDAAYQWANRHCVGRHQTTGDMQLVHTQYVQVQIETPSLLPPLLERHNDDYLLSLGVPHEALTALREVRTDDELLEVCGQLPMLIGEALLDLADGTLVVPHYDETHNMATKSARYEIVAPLEEGIPLETMLSDDFESWMVFLHPEQSQLVEGIFTGPVAVMGAPGTGKTIVALHRARELARRQARVLLATYTKTLAKNLEAALAIFCNDDERKLINVSTLHAQAIKYSKLQPIQDGDIEPILKDFWSVTDTNIEWTLLWNEWKGVIQPRGILSWAAYRDSSRIGRGTPLTLNQRHALWLIFQQALQQVEEHGKGTFTMCALRAAESLKESSSLTLPYDAVLLDEYQDITSSELELVAALGARNPENIMVFGDPAQRIYASEQQGMASILDLRGRTFWLKTHYRNTEQIRLTAERIVSHHPQESGRRSMLSGPEPQFKSYQSSNDEVIGLASVIEQWIHSGINPNDIGVLVRRNDQVEEIKTLLYASHHIESQALKSRANSAIRLGTMHASKGLEFRAVALLGCGHDNLSNAYWISNLDDPQDQEDALMRERFLLYVAMTRARDELFISWVGQPSPILSDDLEHRS